MSCVLVTGDDRTITASLTLDKSAAKAGEVLAAAATVKAALVNFATRALLSDTYTIAADKIDTTAATVAVDIPAEDSGALDPAVVTVLEIEVTDGAGKKLTWTDLGPILIKRGAIA